MLWASDEAAKPGPILVGGILAPVVWLIATATLAYWQLFVNASGTYIFVIWVLITAGLFFLARWIIKSGLSVTVRLWTPDGEGGSCYRRRDPLRAWWDKPEEFWRVLGRSNEVWLYSPDPIKEVKDWKDLSPAEFSIGPGQSSAAFYKMTQPDEVRTWNKTHAQRTTAQEVVKYGVLLAMFGGFLLGAIAID